MLEDLRQKIGDTYYQGLGNTLSGIQDLQARIGYTPDREIGYVTQAGKNPFSIRKQKYVGENTMSLVPPVASKSAKTMQGQYDNYIRDTDKFKPGSNRVLIKNHTHPSYLNSKTSSSGIPIKNAPPSPQDFLNAANTYSHPANSNLKYHKNSVLGKENGKTVRYTYDIPEALKEELKTNPDRIQSLFLENRMNTALDTFTSSVQAIPETFIQKKNYGDAVQDIFDRKTAKRYSKMGYPVTREEL